MAETRQPKFVDGWLASVPRSMIVNLGHLREYSNIEVCESDDQLIWMRGKRLEDKLHHHLRSLLGCEIFQQLEDSQLVPSNSTIPHGYSPQGTWTSLQNWLTISLPLKRFPAELVPTVEISLVRSSCPEVPGLLCASLRDWTLYASTAAKIRLDRLQFACNGDQAVIVGEPLPPIKGDYFYLRQSIATPVGFDWEPALDARVLRDALKLKNNDIAILLPKNSCQVISSSQFVGATRSAVRLTAEVLDGES